MDKTHYLPVPTEDNQRKTLLKMQMDQLREKYPPSSDTDISVNETTMLHSPTDKQKLGYEETLIYGKYRKELSSFAKFQAKRRMKTMEKEKDKEKAEFGKVKLKPDSRVWDLIAILYVVRDSIFTAIGEDWVFLTLMGMIMGVLSFVMDFVVEKMHAAKFMLYERASFSLPLQYFVWVMFPLLLISFSTGFTHLVAPQAMGSGIPEMKTILRGVVLKEFLKFRTLVSKVVGLAASLGSTLHIGKEGPFVHIACMVATLLTKLSSFKGIYANESRRTEMLAVACAVGVAGTYAAPIGGVLFSIEVTATYFAVRNYWRGFFTATVVSVVFRMLGIWSKYEETITTMFKTSLKNEYPFYPVELLAFAFVGVVCGFTAALFILLHRRVVLFTRQHKKLSAFLQKNRFIYPGFVTILIASCTFPPGIGQYFAGELPQKRAIYDLFSNITWTKGQANNLDQEEILSHWKHPETNVHASLALFVFMQFWMSALCNTLPIAVGVFIPVFTIGAGIGRLVGEGMAAWFPDGVNEGSQFHRIIPGGYAVVGAAAFSGGVTRTISTSVMVFEVTGQISHVIPAVIAVLIANAIANLFQPSFYDSVIRLKRLPFLPSIVSSKVDSWNVFVEDIMVREVLHVSFASTYRDLKNLIETTSFRSYPLVDSTESMILLGSVKRFELKRMLWEHLNKEQHIQKLEEVAPSAESNLSTNQPSSTTPEVDKGKKPKSKSRFFISKVDETQQTSKPRTTQKLAAAIGKRTIFAIHRSASAGKLEDLTQQVLESKSHDSLRLPIRSILKQVNAANGAEVPLGASVRRASHPDIQTEAAQLSENQKDSIAEDVPFILNKSNIQTLARTVKLPPETIRVTELPLDEQELWEDEQLSKVIDWEGVHIDPAPFQLVQRTSLHKVHSLFSLLGLNHAYVTNIGRLAGVVSLKEVRKAIQGRLDELAAKKKQKKVSITVETQTIQLDSNSEDDDVFDDPQQLEVEEPEEAPDEFTVSNTKNGKVNKDAATDISYIDDTEKTSLV